jgi:hypothetical protein
MAKFDYKHAKEEIAQINAIVELCPDVVKEKCFELLFAKVFGAEKLPTPAVHPDAPAAPKEAEKPTASQSQAKKLPSNVLAFTRKYGVTEDDLGKLFILDHEPLLPIYKLPTKAQAQAQLFKVMMILLENGLLNNSLSAPYPELRDSVKEDGLLDSNFNMTLKRYHDLFRGAITESSIETEETVELSGAGMQKLAEIVKELSQSVG